MHLDQACQPHIRFGHRIYPRILLKKSTIILRGSREAKNDKTVACGSTQFKDVVSTMSIVRKFVVTTNWVDVLV